MQHADVVTHPEIDSLIHIIRGHKVILDADLARLYDVPTKMLKRAVRRHPDRFPPDFMLELTPEEAASLRYQFGTLERGQYAKYQPFAFTEEGVAMLSSVLHSSQAVSVNVEIMRAFVRLRHLIESNYELSKKIADLEKKYDQRFGVVFQAIKKLMERPIQSTEQPEAPRKKIGY